MPRASTSRANSGAKSPNRPRRGVLGALLYWAPVWLAGILVGQIVVAGLKPGLAEAKRLDLVEQELVEREVRLEAERELQERNRRMLEDEIYRERVRKSVRIAGKTPLQLQHDLPSDQ